MKPRSACLAAFLAGTILLAAAAPASGQQRFDDAFSNSLINPLTRYLRFKELNPFKQQVDDLLAELQRKNPSLTNVTVYFRSMTDGIWFGINEKALFLPGSLLKVPVMMAYFKKAEKDPSVLGQRIVYDIPGGRTELTPPEARKGRAYTAEELIGFMIRYSDNNALKLLVLNDQQAVARTFDDLGIRMSTNPEAPEFSIKDVVRFFRVLYNAAYLDKEMSEKALRILSETRFREGIVAGLPAGVKCAHKYGIQVLRDRAIFEMHDCGIVYFPVNPYLLGISVRTRLVPGAPITAKTIEKEQKTIENIMKRISGLIYGEIERQYGQTSGEYEFQE
jgi:beta-lactamase class A